MQQHIHEPKQKRGQERQEAVIQAGLRLLKSETLESLTMTQLAKESGCSVGNIYKRFSGKKGFLEVLIASADADMMEVTSKQLADASTHATTLREAIDAITTTMVTTCREYRGLIRAIRLYRLKHYPEETPNLARTRKKIAELELELIRKFLPPDLDFEPHERAIRFAMQAVFSNIVQVAMLPVGFVEIDDDDFIDLSANMLAVSLQNVILLSERRS